MQPQVETGIVSPALTGYQTRPGPTNVREHFKGVISKKLGIAQLIIGILCVVLQIVWFVLVSDNIKDNKDYDDFYDVRGAANAGSGLYCGIFFIIGGVLGILTAKHKTVCNIVALMVWSIICATLTIVVLTCSAVGIGSDNDNNYNSVRVPRTPGPLEGTGYYRDYDYVEVSNWTPVKKVRIFVVAIILCLSITEAVLAIWTSSICCAAVCCCNKSTRRVTYNQPMQCVNMDGTQQITYLMPMQGPAGVVYTPVQLQGPGGMVYPPHPPGVPLQPQQGSMAPQASLPSS